jgi:hypothetical protein
MRLARLCQRLRLPTFLVGPVLGVGLSAACHNLQVYAIVGQKYDVTNDCLQAKDVLDVIDGVASGTCTGVRCFQSTKNDDVFISGSCTAPEDEFTDETSDESNTDCQQALALHAKGKVGNCPSDGGAGGSVD